MFFTFPMGKCKIFGILNFRRENWRFFTFSEGKWQIWTEILNREEKVKNGREELDSAEKGRFFL